MGRGQETAAGLPRRAMTRSSSSKRDSCTQAAPGSVPYLKGIELLPQGVSASGVYRACATWGEDFAMRLRLWVLFGAAGHLTPHKATSTVAVWGSSRWAVAIPKRRR